MAFDFRYFADALTRAGQTFANRYNWEWQRQKEMEYSMKEAESRQALQTKENIRQEDVAQANRIAALHEEDAIADQNRIDKMSQESQFDFLLKSPDFARHYANATMSSNPMDRIQLASQLATINKITKGELADKDDMGIINTLDPQSQRAMFELIRANEDRDLQHKTALAYARAAEANATASLRRDPEQFIPTWDRLKSSASDDLVKTTTSEAWRQAMLIKNLVIQENPGANPADIDIKFRERLLQQGLLEGYLMMDLNNSINQRTIDMATEKIMELQGVSPEKPEETSFVGPPTQPGFMRAPGQLPGEQVSEEIRRNLLAGGNVLPPKPGLINKPETFIKRMFSSQPIEKKKDFVGPIKPKKADIMGGLGAGEVKRKDIISYYNIPETATIRKAKNDEELASMARSGDVYPGDYVFVHKELHLIGGEPGNLQIAHLGKYKKR